MTTAADLDQLLSVQQVADLLGVSTRTVRRLQWAGALPEVRVGHAVRFRSSDVATYLRNLGSLTSTPSLTKNR